MEPLKISHHPTNSGGHRHCGSEKIMALACHMILQGYMIKRSCNFMDRSPSKQVTILHSYVAITTLVVEFSKGGSNQRIM